MSEFTEAWKETRDVSQGRIARGEVNRSLEQGRVDHVNRQLEQADWLLSHEGEILDGRLFDPEFLDFFCYPPA